MANPLDWGKVVPHLFDTAGKVDPSFAETLFKGAFVKEKLPRLDEKKWSDSEPIPFHRELVEKGVADEVYEGIASDLRKRISTRIHPGCVNCENRNDNYEVSESINSMVKRVVFVSGCKRPKCMEAAVIEPMSALARFEEEGGPSPPLKTQPYADYRVEHGLAEKNDTLTANDVQSHRSQLVYEMKKERERIERDRENERMRIKREREQAEYARTADIRGEW